MSLAQSPNLFTIAMFPSVKLREIDLLNKLLDIFEQYENFIPTHWGNNELVRLDYNRNDILNIISAKDIGISELYLYRNQSYIEYSGRFNLDLSFRSFFEFDFKKMATEYWHSFFEFSDQCAEILKPRYGIAHIFWPSVIPWETETERLQRWINFCSQPAPVNLGVSGPLGLSTRTYFGPDILTLIDQEILKNTPAIVNELKWGGICIDVAEKPLEVSKDDLLQKWDQAMNSFEENELFAVPKFNQKNCRSISFQANKIWENYIKSNLEV
ncbi:hypothetical protein [Paenibacillus sp. Z6-24]